MTYEIFDENLYMMYGRGFSQSNDLVEVEPECSKAANTDIIPSSAILKQLAEVEPKQQSKKWLDPSMVASSKASSPIREKANISISVMKSLVLPEKNNKIVHEFGSDEKVEAVLDAEGQSVSGLEAQINISLVKDIHVHGAPLESIVVRLSEAISRLRTLRKMASFWSRVVS